MQKKIERAQLIDELRQLVKETKPTETKQASTKVAIKREYTLEEIGRELGVTRERIRQIEAKALKKLQKKSRSKLLEDFAK